MHCSLEALLPWLSSDFWRWICKDSLSGNRDHCLDLSIITLAINVCVIVIIIVYCCMYLLSCRAPVDTSCSLNGLPFK